VPTPLRDAAVPNDSRVDQLVGWLTRVLSTTDFVISVASADASFRRYFRVTRGAASWVAMDAPPGKEDVGPYLRIADMLVGLGVNAPRVLERNVELGFLLSSDLGSRTYLMELDEGGESERLYRDAIDALIRIQAGGREHTGTLPPYDDALLRREMDLFPEWFCGRHLGLSFTEQERAVLHGAFEVLAVEALRQPVVFVHRDYHSRNLMVCDGARQGANPGILDFQDAVAGPVTYDLVSLLRDCYVAWPLERVHGWLVEFRDRARAAGLAVGGDGEFLRWFDLMGVQRHLKAIGIFARLWHRDGKRGYLKDIPRTLGYVRYVCAQYRELAPIAALIETRVAPALARIVSS
jgi:N-acetylmuramate 1-kinase